MLKSLSVQDLNETGLMNVGLYGPTWCVYLCELFCFYIGNDFSSMVQTKKYQYYYYYCFCQNHSWETTTRAEFSLSFHSIQMLTYNLKYNRTQLCWFILKRNLRFGPIFFQMNVCFKSLFSIIIIDQLWEENMAIALALDCLFMVSRF